MYRENSNENITAYSLLFQEEEADDADTANSAVPDKGIFFYKSNSEFS